MSESDFQRVLAEGRALQVRLADYTPVAVGGTAAALHCGHRFSLDVDVVTAHLATRFDEVKNTSRLGKAGAPIASIRLC